MEKSELAVAEELSALVCSLANVLRYSVFVDTGVGSVARPLPASDHRDLHAKPKFVLSFSPTKYSCGQVNRLKCEELVKGNSLIRNSTEKPIQRKLSLTYMVAAVWAVFISWNAWRFKIHGYLVAASSTLSVIGYIIFLASSVSSTPSVPTRNVPYSKRTLLEKGLRAEF